MSMASEEIVFSVAYFLIAFGFVVPPTEFISAGFTVQNIFHSFLGSEQVTFIPYHIRRTSVTLLIHSVLPLGYFLGASFFSPKASVYHPSALSLGWQLYLLVSVVLPVCAGVLVYYWSRCNWANHPIAKALAYHTPAGSGWTSVASSVNIEFRRIDKFMTGVPGRRVIVTDSWVMKTAAYTVHIAHQSSVHLTLVGSDEHELSHESAIGVQYLNITVSSITENVKPFRIRLNAMEYGDLREKLQSPVRHARDVIIQQSLSDRFLEAFRQTVSQNDPYTAPPDQELESCIGCMQKEANVKLRKQCAEPEEGSCVECYCRPMWCLECMGKWFASRQNQQEPETWLGSQSPCPTCRAKFCVLDVCLIL